MAKHVAVVVVVTVVVVVALTLCRRGRFQLCLRFAEQEKRERTYSPDNIEEEKKKNTTKSLETRQNAKREKKDLVRKL